MDSVWLSAVGNPAAATEIGRSEDKARTGTLFSLGAGLEYGNVDAVRDPMQDHYQWATISAGYATGNWWIPGVRVSYRKKMEGSELDYLGAGVILFKVLNLDIASTTQSTKISGTDLARGLTVNLGIEISL